MRYSSGGRAFEGSALCRTAGPHLCGSGRWDSRGGEMDYRNLGGSDLRVSAIGFGCWEMAGSIYGHIEVDEVTAAIHRALDLDVTLFDTAPGYGNGRSEELLGRALRGHRSK